MISFDINLISFSDINKENWKNNKIVKKKILMFLTLILIQIFLVRNIEEVSKDDIA